MSLNAELDCIATGRPVNEAAIESWLETLQATVSANDPCFWLLLARLTELAIVSAGRYADDCEFAAAGDLLVNPRLIRVHFRGEARPAVVKHRRGSLSAQFNTTDLPHHDFMQWFRHTAAVEIVRAPLLTFFMEMLETSGLLCKVYIGKVRDRMDRIAETLGFLSSWQVTDAVDFRRRLSAATPETRQFVCSHLCNFDLDLFANLGHDIQCLALGAAACSDFLDPSIVLLRTGD